MQTDATHTHTHVQKGKEKKLALKARAAADASHLPGVGGGASVQCQHVETRTGRTGSLQPGT